MPETLDEKIWNEIKNKISLKTKSTFEYEIHNTSRAVGTRLSNYFYKKFGNKILEKNPLVLKFNGSAGQSLGAFLTKGVKIIINGDANDYVGKGLSGGEIVVRPSKKSKLISNENTIIGNTVLYGATSGKLFASGKAGERFAVRNSGGISVVEGCGSNGCEYMTGGTAIILGDIGDNFAAGMTGGMSFVYDPDNKFSNHVNPTSVIWQIPETNYWKEFLKSIIEEFYKETLSPVAYRILEKFEKEVKNFKQVCPIEMLDKIENPISLKNRKSKTA